MAQKFDSLGIRAIFMELAPDTPSERQAVGNAINLATTAVAAPVAGGGVDTRSALRR